MVVRGTFSDAGGTINIGMDIEMDDDLISSPYIPVVIPAATNQITTGKVLKKVSSRLPIDIENVLQHALELSRVTSFKPFQI